MRRVGAVAFVVVVAVAACAGRPPDEGPKVAHPEGPDAAVEGAAWVEAGASVTTRDAAPSSADASSPLVASAETPRGPKLRVRRLPAVEGCALDGALARLGTQCRRVQVASIDGTGPGKDDHVERAFDGSRCTHWNAGAFPPQAIRGAIADAAPIVGVLLVPEMTPSGNATHVLQLGDKTYVAEATWTSEALHFVVVDQPAAVTSITVRTTASPSWIAWREIVPFTCERLAVPADATEESPTTPRPTPAAPREFARPGKGACTVDADCVPADCCHPKTCAAVAVAPRCEGVGCAQNVVPGTIGHGARCACLRGRCGAMVRDFGGGLL